MSYDLQFWKRKTDAVSKSDIEHYLDQLPNTTRSDEHQWFYHNEDTGAYCGFEYDPREEDDLFDEDEFPESFREFEDTQFTFNINFIRPQFFGKECFPRVDQLAADLNLYIFNLQGEAEIKQYEQGELEKEWAASNLRVSNSNYEGFNPNYLALEKSDNAWEYNRNRMALQEQLGDNYFVPGIFYLKPKDSHTVATFSVWPQHCPYVLPQVDYLMIQKKIKKLFRTKTEEGLIPYADLVRHLGAHFEEQGTYHILHPEQALKLAKPFNALPLTSSLPEFGEVVPADSFVNVKGE